MVRNGQESNKLSVAAAGNASVVWVRPPSRARSYFASLTESVSVCRHVRRARFVKLQTSSLLPAPLPNATKPELLNMPLVAQEREELQQGPCNYDDYQ